MVLQADYRFRHNGHQSHHDCQAKGHESLPDKFRESVPLRRQVFIQPTKFNADLKLDSSGCRVQLEDL